MKSCRKCGVEKPLSDFQLRTDSGNYRTECRPCRSQYNLDRYHSQESTKISHRKSSRNSALRAYGLTLDQVEQMLADQNGVCLICSKELIVLGSVEEIQKVACVDHCHKTGKVRGLLCRNCNTGLGSFKDDTDFLKKAIEYLEGPKYEDLRN